MLVKLFTLYVYLQSALCGCGSDRRDGGFEKLPYKYKLERISQLDAQVLESSGLAKATDSTYWTHSDGENPANLFEVTENGKLLQTLNLELQNIDWEDLAEDKNHLYIGDFGNNANNRRDLRIYKVAKPTMELEGTIDFSLPDQKSFPPPKDSLHFDLESFFWHQDSLYIFSKSRGPKKEVKMYSLSALLGNYTAKLIQTLPLNAMTTAADISPTKDLFAVLGYGRLYLFQVSDSKINLNGKRYCVPIPKTGQAEALLFTSPQQLLLTNESGKVYQLTLKKPL